MNYSCWLYRVGFLKMTKLKDKGRRMQKHKKVEPLTKFAFRKTSFTMLRLW